MINVTDSLQIDSLKSIVEICRGQQDSLNSIIKANTSVLDINTANNKFALDSLTNHIQICQSQIDSIYAHAEPMKHLGYYGKSIILRLQEVNLWDIYFVYFVCGIILCGIYMYVMNRSKRHELSLSNARENDDKLKIIKRIKEWINKRMYNKPKTPWQLIKKLLFIFVVFVPFLPFYYVSFISQFRDYFGPFKGNKIKRHRELYSKDGNPLLWFSTKVAFFIPLTLWIVTTVFNFFHLNFSIYHALDLPNESSAFWQIICQYLDPGNIANSQGYGGSGIALLSALLGIVCLSGFLVSAIVNVISQTRIQWQKGLINYNGVKKFKDYVVIIGINEQTASIARRALDSDNKRYVLIQTRQDVEKVRPELESKIDDKIQDRIVYYAGDRTSYEDIEKLHLEYAIEVYILGESVENTNKRNSDDQLEKEHDAYNISCLEHISKYIQQYGKKLKEDKKDNKKYEKWRNKSRLNVHVQFDYQSTFTAFKATHLYQKLGRDIRFIPFNIHELWAKKVLVDNLAIYPAGNKTELKVQRYYPIDTYVDKNDHGKRKGITLECHKTVHLVILGMNQMGTALATQAALLCHFPNFVAKKSKKTVITFIDDNAIREAEYYMGRYSTLFELSHYTIKKDNGKKIDPVNDYYPNFKDRAAEFHHLVAEIEKESKKMFEDCLLDVEWEFIQGNAASKPVQQYIKDLVVKDNGNPTDKTVTIAICFNDSQQSLASAMYLPKTVYDHCNQVLVYQRSIFEVANDVARGDSDWRRYQNLFPFGMSEASYTENPFDSHLAALDYYMYEDEEKRELVEGYFNPDKTKKVSNVNKQSFENSFLKDVDDAWENAGIVRKTASIDSVDSIPFKLRSMGIEYCRNLDEIEKLVGKNAKNDIKNRIVEAEHNRWMMQRLVSGYRPFTKDEQKYFEDLRTLIKEVRNNIQVENNEFITKLNKLRDDFLNDINNVEEKKARKEELDRIIDDVVEIKGDENKVNDLLNRIGRVIEHRIDEKKDEERASYCICSLKRMEKIAEGMISNDKSVIESIPILLRGHELLNVSILTSKDERYKYSQHKKVLEEIYKDKFILINGRIEECKEGESKKKNTVYCKHNFWMADTAVSRKIWQYVTGKQVCKNSDDAKLPVVSVSKNDVEDFLAILRKKSGLYFDIPSISEWRTAADSGHADNVTKDNKENGMKWNCKHSSDIKDKQVELKPVGEGRTGKLQHFFGNVWEWTHKMDEHGKGLYKFVGGSFRFGEKECSPNIDTENEYWWHSWDADSKSDDLGFRLVWKYDRSLSDPDENTKKESGAEPQKNEKIGTIIKWFKEEKHKFVKVDSGYFVMGDEPIDDKQDKRVAPDANEGPRHTVHISEPFYMCKVPVTQSLWNAVMEEKKSRLNPTTNRIGDEFPQTDVSWKKGDDGEPGVKEFLEKLNERLKNEEGLKKCICAIVGKKAEEIEKSTIEFRLPTEAEWEYAAKGGMKIQEIKENEFKENGAFIPVPIKKDKKGKLKTSDKELYVRKEIQYPLYATRKDGNAIDFAWFDQPSIHEVAQKEPNALDLYDMSGNVWEWCHDYYIADVYDACKIGENKKIQNTFIKHEYQNKGYITDPIALDDSYSAHVFRGGSWRSSKWDCRCTRANYWGENYKANDLGFRLVLGVPISELGKAEKE